MRAFTADLDEVLADDTVDAVALATPVPLHAEMAIRVLRAGKHCFVEKPMATDREPTPRRSWRPPMPTVAR